MEQYINPAPQAPTTSGSRKSNNTLKIVATIVCVLAVCSIGFNIYNIIQISQKDHQISDLKAKLEKYEKIDTDEQSQSIPDSYIAVFHGGVGERTYETYIYKDDNGQDNYGFTYINTTSTTKSWGSSEWDTKITKRGSFSWTDGAFSVAKENGAYSYVTTPNSDRVYTIEEFQQIFLMD